MVAALPRHRAEMAPNESPLLTLCLPREKAPHPRWGATSSQAFDIIERKLERANGFEPSTLTLARLLPPISLKFPAMRLDYFRQDIPIFTDFFRFLLIPGNTMGVL